MDRLIVTQTNGTAAWQRRVAELEAELVATNDLLSRIVGDYYALRDALRAALVRAERGAGGAT